MSSSRMGIAGRIAAAFLDSRLTPLLVISSVLLGTLGLLGLPREEEPQIQVPMVDVRLAWPGQPAEQVERQLTAPVERRLWEIPGLEYLYSTSNADGALLILRFQVGMSPELALTRVRTRLDEAIALLPPSATIASIESRSIDDVPVLALTLTAPGRDDWDHGTPRGIAEELAAELRKSPGVSRIGTRGGEPRTLQVRPDPGRMAQAGVTVDVLLNTLAGAGFSFPAGSALQGGAMRELRTESPFASAEEVSALAVTTSVPGETVRLSEIAEVVDGPNETTRSVWRMAPDGAMEPAVTLEIAKRPGVNATTLVHALHARVEELQGSLLSRDVQVHTTRDLGETAKHKSDDLIFHLMLATASVVALIALALGRREAVVVAIAIPVTLALTLFAYRFLGYTLNRVTLFALIFSIGILVDDAIVVVENIARHFGLVDARERDHRVIEAVDEVGNPTILATFTVIAAILPLAFVGGLMGPYMKPIPVGASLAMLISLGVAFAISPWAARRVLHAHAGGTHTPHEGRLDALYRRMMRRLLERPSARVALFGTVGALFLGSVSLVVFRAVTVKMLPFDNKSEFEIVLDLPPGSTHEETLAAAQDAARLASRQPEVSAATLYVGQGAPITFNGLVRHYDFRRDPRFAEVQVILAEPGERKRQSHDIAKSVRESLGPVAERHGAIVKVVEVPPGPPVLSTLVAEIYGPDLDGQREFARQVHRVFAATENVVDTELLLTENAPRTRFVVDRDRAAIAGVAPSSVAQAAAALYAGQVTGVLRAPESPEPVPIQVRLGPADRADLAALSALRLGGPGAGEGVPMSELARVVRDSAPPEIHRKNLRRVVYVLGDVAGEAESPVYAIADLRPAIQELRTPNGIPVHQLSTALPESDERYSLKWDGEWHITYEVFRDMGAAFAVVLVLIYLLTVGWFKSFTTPLVIMLPIPLSLIGILPAHWITGAFFTATSMIGFIAGAGITVRNSIILVDFIELRRSQGYLLREAIIDAGAVRFRPMVLTAAAVAVGAGVILFDPIFQGLAVALIGGEVAATAFSRVAVPVLYYLLKRQEGEPGVAGEPIPPLEGRAI